jgi:Arc/MetJ-type ribon-helix-helix transcriptional regulator
MIVHLPRDVESSINAEMGSGHFASADDAIAERRRSYLQQRMQARPVWASRLGELHRQSRANPSRKPSSASGGDVAAYFFDSGAIVKRSGRVLSLAMAFSSPVYQRAAAGERSAR